jgi:hypothetical protein
MGVTMISADCFSSLPLDLSAAAVTERVKQETKDTGKSHK